MAFSIPEYNDRIIANPESRPQINLNQPKELSDTSFIDRATKRVVNFQKEENEILLDMKKERDNGIVNEFMNQYSTARVEKINELKEKYKGANAQGIVDEFKKWQDDYYTSHLGFSSANEDGTLYLENDEQIKSAREQLARNLPTEINSLSTYAATELEGYRQNQFTARTQFAVDDLADERDVNNIAMGIDNIYKMVNDYYDGESEEFKRYTAGNLVNESLSVNVADMIAAGETLEQLNLAEQMLKEGVVADNLTNKTKADLSEKLREKQMKILGKMLATGGTSSKGSDKGNSTKVKGLGEDLAFGDKTLVPEDLSEKDKATMTDSFVDTLSKKYNEYEKNNQQLTNLAVEAIGKIADGQQLSDDELRETSFAYQLNYDEVSEITNTASDIYLKADNLSKALVEVNQRNEALIESTKASKDTAYETYQRQKEPEKKSFLRHLGENLFDAFGGASGKFIGDLWADSKSSSYKLKQASAFDRSEEAQDVIDNIREGSYDIKVATGLLKEISKTNPYAAKVGLDEMVKKSKVDNFYFRNKDADKIVESLYKDLYRNAQIDKSDYRDFRERIAIEKVRIQGTKNDKTYMEIAADIYKERKNLVTAHDRIMNTKTKVNAIKQKEDDLTNPYDFRLKLFREALDGDEYDKYNLEDATKDMLADWLAQDLTARVETYLRSLGNGN